MSTFQGDDDESGVGEMQQQVTQLKLELEQTHVHYQRLLESVAGPAWTQDMGPLERSGPSHAAPANGRGHHASDASALTARDGAGGVSSAPSVSFAGGVTRADSVSASSMMGIMHGQTLEAQTLRLEGQVEGLRAALKTASAEAASRQQELDSFRDRMSEKDHLQFHEIKKLRAAILEGNRGHGEEKVALENKLEQARVRFEEDRVRLVREADGMRTQLGDVTGSITSMIAGRSAKVDSDRQRREDAAVQRDGLARQQLAELSVEKDRQLGNLKEQSSYFLSRKATEIAALRSELNTLRTASTAEAEVLKAEVEYLAGYAEKLTEVLRRLEAGVYSVHEKQGIKSLKIPARDKPAQLESERLRYLASRSDLADALLAVTQQAPPPSDASNMSFALTMGGGGGAPPSRGGSASSVRSLSRTAVGDANGDFYGSVPGSGHVRAHSASHHFGGTNGSTGGLYSTAGVEVLRTQWEAETKAAVTAQAMLDLRSDKTVEYIRSLESQVARYRTELQAEKRKGNEAAVALRSAQRAGAMATSSVGKALSGTGLARLPTWGLGHGIGTASRPGSAASPGSSGPLGGGMLPRPTTAMSQLTSGFAEYRVS